MPRDLTAENCPLQGGVPTQNNYVSVIGGANIDIAGKPFRKLIPADSNPGEVSLSAGGVGRNIAENLARLGVEVKLFTAVGRDMHGDKIVEEAGRAGIDVSHVKRCDGAATGTYLAILDEAGDMNVAVASMGIMAQIDIDYLDANRDIIAAGRAAVFDTNPGQEALRHGAGLFRDMNLYLDPVSHTKALRVKDFIGLFGTIKPNRIEAEALSGIRITGESSLRNAAEYFHNQGVRQVIITMGADGSFYSDARGAGVVKSAKVFPKNATGAGDAFQAALVYAQLEGMDLAEGVRFATGASLVAMAAQETINPDISVQTIKNALKDVEATRW